MKHLENEPVNHLKKHALEHFKVTSKKLERLRKAKAEAALELLKKGMD